LCNREGDKTNDKYNDCDRPGNHRHDLLTWNMKKEMPSQAAETCWGLTLSGTRTLVPSCYEVRVSIKNGSCIRPKLAGKIFSEQMSRAAGLGCLEFET
jgi:hypothetical protein